jgi:hypothetical protein
MLKGIQKIRHSEQNSVYWNTLSNCNKSNLNDAQQKYVKLVKKPYTDDDGKN